MRLVHPDRQAAEVIGLFAGARVAHPAAALAGWKRSARDPNLLGKTLEAAIAMFNPEMASGMEGLARGRGSDRRQSALMEGLVGTPSCHATTGLWRPPSRR